MLAFLHPLMLIGLAGAAVPVLIHLLTRDRIQRVQFSTLRFFAWASTRTLRRRRVQEAILLALRVLVCALIALVLARPFFAAKSAADPALTRAGTARVILADVSASMRRPDLPAALAAALNSALSDLTPGADAAALIAFADAPHTLVRLTPNLAELQAALPTVQPGQGGTDLAAALKAADAVLRPVVAQRKEIVLISDFPNAGWRNFRADWRLPPGVTLVPRALMPRAADPGLAIVLADAPQSLVLDKTPRAVSARIANFGPTDRTGVEVALRVNDKIVATQKVNLRAGGRADLRFRHVFDTPGDHPSTLTILGDDADPADNVFYFNARVTPRIPVLVVNGRPDVNPLTDAATFLRLTMLPGAPFEAQVVSAAAVTPAQVRSARVVVLADVSRVSPDIVAALQDLLAQGGGVWLLPGAATRAESFNEVFAHITPARLGKTLAPIPIPGKPPGAALTRLETEHPILGEFATPSHGDLSLPRFMRYWELSYLGLTDPQNLRVLARFDDSDRPALMERRVGQGVVLLSASPAELAWNDLPMRATFLPLVHETMLYLALRTERPTRYGVGDVLPRRENARLRGPDGAAVDAPAPPAAAPGFYTETDPAGGASFVFAVNRASSEADPTPIAPEKIVAALEAVGDAARDTRAAAVAASTPDPEERDRQHVWWYLALALTALAVVELWLGNRTLRH